MTDALYAETQHRGPAPVDDYGRPLDVDAIELAAWCNAASLELAAQQDILRRANRASSRIRDLAREERRVAESMDGELAAARAEVLRLEETLAAMQRPYRERREWMQAQYQADIFAAAADELERQHKRAGNVRIAGGVVSVRQGSTSLQVADEGAAIEWAKAHLPEAVKTTVSLLKKPVTDAIKATGEAVPGCELVRGPDSLEFTPDN